MSLLLYFAQITIIALFVAMIYRGIKHRRYASARQILVVGLLCILSASVLALFPLYEIIALPHMAVENLLPGFEYHPTNSTAQKTASNPIDWGNIVLKIFVALILIRLVFFAIELRALQRLKKNGSSITNDRLQSAVEKACQNYLNTRRYTYVLKTRFILSNEIKNVATLGIVRPTILLPMHWKGWQDKQLRAVIAHELEHVYRFDFLLRLVAEFVRVTHFYHPIVCWLTKQYRIEQECSADIAASAFLGEHEYEMLLVEEALGTRRFRQLDFIPSFTTSSKSLLRKRIETLRVRKKQALNSSSWWRVCFVIAGPMLLAALMCGVHLEAQTTPSSAAEPTAASILDESDDQLANEKSHRQFGFLVEENLVLLRNAEPSEPSGGNTDGNQEQTTLIGETFNYSFKIPSLKNRSSK